MTRKKPKPIGPGDEPTLPPRKPDRDPRAEKRKTETLSPGEDVTIAASQPSDPAAAESSAPIADETLPPITRNERRDLKTQPHHQTQWRPGGKIGYFGDYELLSEIARGGMGVVYRARQKRLNRIVALKMILAGQLAGDEEVQRFHAEAEAAANLDHPGIVPIYEVGEVEGQHYFSMGYVEGSSLAELIGEHPLPPREAAELTLKVAEAISYAHEQGVIHRDLKPANVLVQQHAGNTVSSGSGVQSTLSGSQSNISQWSPRVTDFGLAKRVQGDDHLTASGQILGTPSYMPPEQASGKTDKIDYRADIYSLGGILYALMTGRPPFQAANPLDTLVQMLEREPVPPRQLDPKLPRDIETIALKSLEKDPRRRYQTAGEMADDLRRFLNGEPILARSVTRAERAWRWARRKPLVAGLGAVAATLLIIISLGGPVVAVQQSALRAVAEKREGEANDAKLEAQRAAELEKTARKQAVDANMALAREKENAERTLYARTISLAYQAWHDDNVARTEDLLNKTDHEYRDWEWQFIKNLCNSEKQTLRGHTGIPFRMRLSADGARLVSIGRVHGLPAGALDANVYLWDLETGNVIKKLPYRGFAISPDARLVALEKAPDGPIVIIDIESEKEVASIRAHDGGTAWANFNTEGTRLVTTGPDKAVRIWDAATGEEVLAIRDERRHLVHDVNFSPDDKLLVWKTFDGMIQIRDAASGEKVIDIEDRIYRNDSVGVAISPDNKVLAAASNGPIHFFDLKSGEKIASLFGHRSSVLDLCFSPDGKRLTSCGTDGTVRVWNVAERRESFRFRGHKFGTTYGVWEVIYSNDGKWIISGGSDTTIKIWPADGGDGFLREEALAMAEDVDLVEAASVYPEPSQEKDWLVGNTDYVEAVAFSPDGQLVASASKDDTVRIFDAATRETVHVFTGHEQDVAAVAFSPDGKLLASGEGGINDNRNGQILLWDLTTNKKKGSLAGHGGPIVDVIFDETGDIIYSATGSQRVSHRGEIFAWNIKDEKIEFRYEEIGGVTDMALSPDGTVLAIASYTQPIHLIDTQTGKLIKKIGSEREIFSAVDFSPDGKQLAVGTLRWAVGVWDVERGVPLWVKTDHSGAVTGVAFTPGGNRVISASVDQSTRVWDTTSGDMLVDLEGDSLQLFGVTVSPDGNAIASFGEAPYITLRDLSRGNAVALAEAMPDKPWPVIFQDDFDREDLGQQWDVINGIWEIEEGAAKGTLALLASVPIPNFAATTIVPRAWFPSVVEIEFDAWAPRGVIFETKLSDEAVQNGIDSLFIGMDQPYFNQTRPGGSLVVQAAGGFAEVARTGSSGWFKPNQRFKLKTIRRRGRWEMYVDDKPLLQADVPESMWAPTIHIQGSFANPGEVLYIDNFVVRAPTETADEVMATTLEYELRQKLKLKALVIDAIQNRDNISDSVRHLALQYARQFKEDSGKRQKVIREILLNDDTDGDSLQPLTEVLASESDEDNAWEFQQLTAAAQYRLGKYEEALRTLKEAEQRYRRKFAMSHPVNMALLALVSDAMGNQQRVTAAIDRLTELMRSDYWRNDEYAVAWRDKALQAVNVPEPHDAALAAEMEAIKRLTFEPMQRALCRYQNKDYFAIYTDDAWHIEGRGTSPDPNDVRISHAQWQAAEQLFETGAAPLHTSLVRSRADVLVDGDAATLSGQYTATMPFAHWRWESEVRLKKAGGQWKIHWERRGITGFRMNTETHIDSPDDWVALDALVETARKEGDDMKILQALGVAFHRQEAFEHMRRMVDGDEDAAQFWAALADRAYAVFDAAEMLRAGKKAVGLNPAVPGAPFLRALAVTEHLPEEASEIGNGIKARIPDFVPEAPIRDFSVPGQVLRAWYPTERSAIIVFFAEGKNDQPLQEGLDEIAENMEKNANVTIYRKELRTLGAREATDLIMEGAGNGRGLSKTMNEAKGTIQRWVITTRGKDLIGFLMTAASNEFDQRNAEFEAWLQHVAIDPE